MTNDKNLQSTKTKEELTELKISIARMEEGTLYIKKKLDEIVNKIEHLCGTIDHINDNKADKGALELVIRKVEELERFKWKLVGISIAAGVTIPYIINYIKE